jgi:hypothetical protein
MKKQNKFNARKCTWQGMAFDSKKEMGRYIELQAMEKQGIIDNLERQVEYELLPKCKYFREVKYIADFKYKWNGQEIIEDVKGLKKGSAYTVFKIKQKLLYNKYNILVKEI